MTTNTMESDGFYQASALRDKNLPKSLFKFRSATSRSFQNLMEDAMWFAPANEVNDPLDTYFYTDESVLYVAPIANEVRSSLLSSEAVKLLSESQVRQLKNDALSLRTANDVIWRERGTPEQVSAIKSDLFEIYTSVARNFLVQFSERLQRAVKISCFTDRFDSIAMWAHYADNHTGFCLGYSSDSIAQTDDLKMTWPVHYSLEVFDATPLFVAGMQSPGQVNPFLGVAASLVKSHEWSYENEWRVVLPTGAETAGFSKTWARPSSIYVGRRASAETKQILMGVATEKNIPLFEMKPSRRRFQLEATPIEATQ